MLVNINLPQLLFPSFSAAFPLRKMPRPRVDWEAIQEQVTTFFNDGISYADIVDLQRVQYRFSTSEPSLKSDETDEKVGF